MISHPFPTREVRVEHSTLFNTWVAYEVDGRTVDVCDTEAEANEAADRHRRLIGEQQCADS